MIGWDIRKAVRFFEQPSFFVFEFNLCSARGMLCHEEVLIKEMHFIRSGEHQSFQPIEPSFLEKMRIGLDTAIIRYKMYLNSF
jgi:hypothetical protein